MLKLDSSKARLKLGWRPVWDCCQALEKTAKWYEAFYEQGVVSTRSDLGAYIKAARSKGLVWAK
jgi:CDP-glucose 4,6-dehydratase